jgi:hypothetical protein
MRNINMLFTLSKFIAISLKCIYNPCGTSIEPQADELEADDNYCSILYTAASRSR